MKIRIKRVSNNEGWQNFEPHFVEFWIDIEIPFKNLGPKIQPLSIVYSLASPNFFKYIIYCICIPV